MTSHTYTEGERVVHLPSFLICTIKRIRVDHGSDGQRTYDLESKGGKMFTRIEERDIAPMQTGLNI